MHSFAVERSMK